MSLEPLASMDDLQNRLGRDLSDEEIGRAPYLLIDASSKIRSYTHQQITQSETTDRVRITTRDGLIRLPQYPVVSVATVISVETQVVIPYYWDGLKLWGWGRFPSSNIETPLYNRSRRHGIVVDVTYTHGYAPVPDEVIGVTCQVASRALGSQPDQAGVTQETYAGYSYTLGTAAASGGFGLLAAETEVLGDYMAPAVGPISMLPTIPIR